MGAPAWYVRRSVLPKRAVSASKPARRLGLLLLAGAVLKTAGLAHPVPPFPHGPLTPPATVAPPSAVAPAETHTVTIKDLAFSPSSLTVAPGDSVRWTNEDTRDHTVVASDGSFSSGNIAPGESYTYRFKTAGEYPYACTLHPRMKASIVVAKP